MNILKAYIYNPSTVTRKKNSTQTLSFKNDLKSDTFVKSFKPANKISFSRNYNDSNIETLDRLFFYTQQDLRNDICKKALFEVLENDFPKELNFTYEEIILNLRNYNNIQNFPLNSNKKPVIKDPSHTEELKKIRKFAHEHLKDKVLLESYVKDLKLLGMSDGVAEYQSVKKILDTTKYMQLNDYNKLSEESKKILRKETGKISENSYGICTENVLNTALMIKQNLDKKYGEGKYVFCSIGRSPALYANVLESMGVETKTCIYSIHREEQDLIYSKQALELYKDYLDKIGISSEKVKNSDKTFVFTDYVSLGHTIREFEKLIKDDRIGLDLENVKIEDMNNLAISGKSKYGYYDYYENNYLNYMNDNLLKKYAYIPYDPSIQYLDIYHKEPYASNASYNGKLFRFALIDELYSKGIIKSDP